MLNGSILDVYPDLHTNAMVTWLVANGKAVKVEDAYVPSFFVYAAEHELHHLASILRSLPEVETLTFTRKKIVLGSDKKALVLEVSPTKIGLMRRLANMIDSWGHFYRYRLFDVDLRLPSRYLQDKGVFSNAKVRWDGKTFFSDDEQWAIDYPSPEYKAVVFDIERRSNARVMSFHDRIHSICIGECVIEEENEADTMLLAVKQLKRVDPDIIYTYKGDSVLFPFLYHRAKLNDIHARLNLGRERGYLRPVKKEKSYFSYGQIVYRPAFYTLRGRAHIDTYNSFLYGESGIHGLLDISRCSTISLQTLSRVGPGTAISQIQVNKAREKGYLIPWKKNMPEDWKTSLDLLQSDRGGLILDPAVGLHGEVIELDFNSLYPNVMLKYNISPETMLCDCCTDSQKKVVPQLGYHICTSRRGLLPEVLRPILFRRFCYKARSKNRHYDQALYKEMQQAWKWVLLVCFGYTGYRNARYGRIECYESITAYSRDILLAAAETVEAAGYCVLHGIIDSLWVKPKKDVCVSPVRLSRMISERTGIRMDVEGRYRWIVFLPNKNHDVGALNRYYGLFDDGTIKIRGVEYRQKDTPRFLRHMQSDMINVFSKARCVKDFLDLIPRAVDVLCAYARRVIDHGVKLEELVFTNRASRDVSEYQVDNLVKSALFQLRDLDVHIEPGQSIRYVVSDEHSRDYRTRVCVFENLHNCRGVDVDFYLRQLAMHGESLLLPFGFTRERFYAMLERMKLPEVLNVSVLPRIGTTQTSIRVS